MSRADDPRERLAAAGEEALAPLSPLPWRPPLRWLERLLLAGMMVGLLALKIRYIAADLGAWPDGSYYYDIAAHVRDGHGLVTDVSLYNAGYTYFPHPTAVYPLWPLVLGWTGRLVPLEAAAQWLPTFFYFGAIALAYRLARRVAPAPLLPGLWSVVNAGHVAAAVLGLNVVFFHHTHRPYTEGFAYFLVLVALTRAERFFKDQTRPSLWRGLELGCWLGLLVLVRSQLVLGVMAVGGALGWALLRLGWRRWLGPSLAVLAGFWAALAPQIVHLSGFVEPLRLIHLLRFDLVREPSELAPLEVMVQTPNALAWLVDRARGALVAFGGGKWSYYHCFGAWAAALVMSVPFLLWDGWLALRRLRAGARSRLWARLHAPGGLFLLTFGLLAIGGVLSLHIIHKAMFAPWNFGTRHALTASFAVFAAIVYLARRPALGRTLAVFVLAAGSYSSFQRLSEGISAKTLAAAESTWTAAHNEALVSWLNARAAASPGLVVVAQALEAQKLARFTDGVGYHWMAKTMTLAELEHLFESRGASLLLLRLDQLRGLKIGGDQGRFGELVVVEVEELSGYTVLRRRLAGEPPGVWPRPPAEECAPGGAAEHEIGE